MEVKEYLSWPRINLYGPIDQDMINAFEAQSQALPPSDTPVVLTLKSNGGNVGHARDLYEEIRIRDLNFNFRLLGRSYVQSSAVTVSMAIPLERRFATPSARFLLHETKDEMDFKLIGTRSARILQMDRANRVFADAIDESIWSSEIVANGCGRTVAEVDYAMHHDTVLVGQKAVEFGLVSAIFEPDHSVLDSQPT